MSRWMRIALMAGLLLGVARAADPTPLPAEPEAAWALVEQERLPALGARQAAAEARRDAATAFFAGERSLLSAFPALEGADLSDPLVLSARLSALDDQAVARELARSQAVPDLGSDARKDRFRTQRTAALDAEDAADGLQRRLFLALRAHLAQHPEQTAGQLAPLRSSTRAALDAARAAADPDNPVSTAQVAARDAEVARLEQLVRTLREQGLVGEGTAPDPSPELALLASADEDTASRADARLQLMGDALDPSVRSEVIAARTRWRTEALLPPLLAALEASPATIDLSESDAVQERIDALVPQRDALRTPVPSSLPETVAAAETRVRDARLQLVERQLTRLQARLSAIAERESQAQSQAQEARLSRQTALDEAQRAESESQAALLTSVAEASRRSALAFDRVSNLEQGYTRIAARREARLTELLQHMADAEESASAMLMSGDRAEPDTAYEEARSEIETLREEAYRLLVLERITQAQSDESAVAIAADRAALMEATRALRDAEDRTLREEALARWRDALADEEDALQLAVTTVEDQETASLTALRDVKAAKRSLSAYVTRAQRGRDSEELGRDLRWERLLVWPNFLSVVTEQAQAVVWGALSLLNPVYLAVFIRQGFWLFLFLGGWWVVRSRSERIARWLVERITTRTRSGDALIHLVGESTHLVRAGLDLAIGWLLRDSLVSFLPLLGFAVWVYLQVALYRFVVAVFDLVVEPFGTPRPALITMGERAHRLSRHTLRWVAMWVITRGFVRQLLQGMLGADGLDTLAMYAIHTAGALGLLFLLHRWEPVLRAEIQGFHQEARWVRFLSAPPRIGILRAPWSLVTGVYLAAAWLWDRTQELARHNEGFGRVLSAVTRFRMAEPSEERASSPLPAEVRKALVAPHAPPTGWVPRAAEQTLTKALTAWDEDHRNGVVMLVAEPGQGKRAFLERWLKTLPSDYETLRVTLDRRIEDEADAVAWLSLALGAEEPLATDKAFVSWVEGLPPCAIVIEDLHRAFVRTVGGFDGLRSLLYLLNAASSRHFVLTTSYRKAYQYIGRLGSLVNVEVMRLVVELAPFGEKDTQKLIQERVNSVGYELCFDALVRRSPFGVDPSIELRRAVGNFFLLLAEASEGNPGVALRLFSQCLSARPGEDSKVLDVHMAPCLGAATLDGLSDDEMFTLVALRTQGGLSEGEIVRVTNISPSIVRNVVRNLLNRGLLVREGDGVSVALDQLPVVTRTLRRRHFLHFTA